MWLCLEWIDGSVFCYVQFWQCICDGCDLQKIVDDGVVIYLMMGSVDINSLVEVGLYFEDVFYCMLQLVQVGGIVFGCYVLWVDFVEDWFQLEGLKVELIVGY